MMGEKMIKIAEFARVNEISDRHARRLFKSFEEDIDGHFEKRGGAGTWLDEYAVEFLRSKLRVQVDPVEVLPARRGFDDSGASAEAQERYADLLELYHEAVKRLADAERRAGENAGAAERVKALEGSERRLELQMSNLRADCDKRVEEVKNAYQGHLDSVSRAYENQLDEKKLEINNLNQKNEMMENNLKNLQTDFQKEKTRRISFREFWQRRKNGM